MNVQEYLASLRENLLHNDNWQTVTMNREWANTIPSTAGVYVLRQGDTVVYVGETGNLRGRMRDLLDTRNHTVRRTIGKKFFSTHKGFVMATTSKKFPDHIEVLVNDHICSKLKVAVLPVALGRKELEELIQSSIDKGIRLNQRGKRL